MKDILLNDIVFELKDTEVFKIPDTKTRIATVQNYFFPRLDMLLRYTMEMIQDIYETNPYESMTFVYYPGNRKTAKENKEFHWVHIGLSGKRRTDRDLKHKRRDGKPFQHHPTYLTYHIDFDGSMRVELMPFRAYVSAEFIADVAALYEENWAALSPIFGLNQISHTRSEQFVDIKDAFVGNKEVIWNLLYSPTHYFPTTAQRGLWKLMVSFAALYPLLSAFNSLGEGTPVNLADMLEKFKAWHLELAEISLEGDEEDNQEAPADAEIANLPELDSYTFVRAGLWWTVLARDNWTCCSCGRSAKEHGITLEVDHIIPRSKGGTDELDNLQTLCKKCNIGKSNKDSTDLRRVTTALT